MTSKDVVEREKGKSLNYVAVTFSSGIHCVSIYFRDENVILRGNQMGKRETVVL